MKIAMIHPSKESEKGISNYALRLIETMKENKIDIDSIPFEAGSAKSFFKILSKLKDYDIIHLQHEYNLLGNYGFPFFLFLPLLKIIKKKALVTTMHTPLSLKEKFPETKLKTFLRKGLYITQNRLINYTSNLTIVHADYFRNLLVKEYGFSNKKIEVVPHGIIENIKLPNRNKSRKELKLNGNVYLMIGNLSEDTGTEVIVRQANEIGKTIVYATNPKAVNTRNNKKLNDYLNLNKEIVKKNKSEKNIRFDLKEIPYDLWWKYFSAADLILLAYRGGIGSGIFSDAMAVGKPVVASNTPYFKEIARDYGCLKIAKKDSDFPKTIHEAMTPKSYKRMKSECKRYFKERGLSAIAKKYNILYSSFIK